MKPRDLQVAEGELQTARGAFDPWCGREAMAPLATTRAVASISRRDADPWWGTTFFGGYRASFGKFADYDGKLETNQYGELRGGVQVPSGAMVPSIGDEPTSPCRDRARLGQRR